MPLRIAAAALLLAAAGCSAPTAGSSSAQARTEAALATVLAVAAAPDADLATLKALLTSEGEAERLGRLPAELRQPAETIAVLELVVEITDLLSTVRTGGRFGYAVEAFAVEPTDAGRWHVLRVRFDDARQTEIEAVFLPVGDALLLGRLDR